MENMNKKKIETPARMWELFTEYKTWAKENPILVNDFVGKDATEVNRKKERPLTMSSFEAFCSDNADAKSIDQYMSNRGGLYTDYIEVCSRIKIAIKADQIEGGMAGIYSTSITQRLNGLVEKQDTNLSGEVGIDTRTIIKWGDREIRI